MKTLVYIVLCLVVLAALFSAYVRLAPQDVAKWHQPIRGDADRDGPRSALRIVDTGSTSFDAINAAMLALPRTQVLAGSVADGRVTYVTRSKLMGFPDYTTVEAAGDAIKLYARARFGQSDMGVNRKRLEQVLAAAQG